MDHEQGSKRQADIVTQDSRRQPWVAILEKLKKEKKDAGKRQEKLESNSDISDSSDGEEMFTYEEGIYYNHTG
jgi:hypothetical protein